MIQCSEWPASRHSSSSSSDSDWKSSVIFIVYTTISKASMVTITTCTEEVQSRGQSNILRHVSEDGILT